MIWRTKKKLAMQVLEFMNRNAVSSIISKVFYRKKDIIIRLY